MSLDGASYRVSMDWRQTRQNAGFLNSVHGPDLISASSDDTEADAVFAQESTLAASAKQTFNLQSLTSLLSQAINFVDVRAMMVSSIDGDVTISPGSSDPAGLFLSGAGAGINIPSGGFCLSASTSTIDATHKNVDLTAGSSGAQFRIAFLGGV